MEVLQTIPLVRLHQISVSSTAAAIEDAFSYPPFSFTHVCYSIWWPAMHLANAISTTLFRDIEAENGRIQG